jgi:2-haloalkanoic acid dehalogenase type II
MYEVVTFDCYGTLIDWESGIAAAFERATGLRREDVLRCYEQIEPQVEREYRPYREVLAECAMRVTRELRRPIEPEQASFLAESLPDWRPFPDTNAALERLRAAGVRLGILSNIDDDLLAATRRHFTVEFDILITAQQVRSYKPAPGHFLAARERIGNARWLHAAQSNFHDIVPANLHGIQNAWINRRGDTPLPGGTPIHEVADLDSLADLVVG